MLRTPAANSNIDTASTPVAVIIHGPAQERPTGANSAGVLVTRHLRFSLQYSALYFADSPAPTRRTRLVDAPARTAQCACNIVGFISGATSPASPKHRSLTSRDGPGSFAAYLGRRGDPVQLCTSRRPVETAQARENDLEIARVNIRGWSYSTRQAGVAL